MNQYVTGSVIKNLREKAKLTQSQLAQKLFVSDKTISKWETGRGFPDISLLENLSKVLGVSVIELLSGEVLQNQNRCANIKKSKIYVCPICSNVIFSIGQAVVSCCGITLPSLEVENDDSNVFENEISTSHTINIEKIEDEYFVSLNHPMEKSHYISFLIAIGDDKIELKKLYPEQNAQARFKISSTKRILAFCNRDGLFEVKL